MMKRLVTILFFLSLLLVATALIAPGFIDWSQHKDRLISQLEPYLGRKIEVGGQVKFRLLPNPQILLEDVSLANAPGAKEPSFIRLKQLEARIKFQPLLQGRFEVDTINLANPEINLEILDDGTPDWTGILKERDAGSNIENEADAIQLNQVTVTGGALHYFNHITGAEWQVNNLDLAVSADTLFGPYRISGDMQYRGNQVAVEIGAGKFAAGSAPIPLHVAFNPVENLPQVKLEGTIDMQGDAAPPPAEGTSPDAAPPQDALNNQSPPPAAPSGPVLRGDLTISEGNLASLFDNKFLHDITFLNDNADFTATLEARGGDVKLSDIKAKFGKKGEAAGSLEVSSEKDKKPVLTGELTGSNLKITDKSGFVAVPEGLSLHLKLKGKALSFDGAGLPAASLTADTDGEKWDVKSARLDLPGKSVVKLTGAVTPAEQYAAYNIQVSTEDLSQMLKSLPLAQGNILKSFDSGVVKKLTLASSLDLKHGSISFSDIDATIEDKIKVSGVLTATQEEKKTSFRANLNLDNADMSIFPAEAWSGFAGRLVKSEGDLTLSVKNFSKGDLKVAAFTLSGATGGGGLQIKDMSGSLDDAGDFKLSGKLTALEPTMAVDLDYSLKTHQPGAVAKALGIALPPPLRNDAVLDIHGHAGGEAKKYTFDADGTAEGNGFTLKGAAETGDDGLERFHNTVHLQKSDKTLLAATGLPLDKLLPGVEDFSAEVSGTHAVYKMDKIAAGPVSGWLSRKEAKYEGELKADVVDLDSWLGQDWTLNNDVKLGLKANKLLWRDNEISEPALTLEAGADHLKVADLNGNLWGGALNAEVDASRKEDAWSGTIKGTDAGAQLDTLSALMGFKGFTLGKGDLDFNLHSDAKAEAKNWFHGIDGTLDIKPESLQVHNFAPGPLADMIIGFKHLPEHLAEQMTGALNSGSTTYKNVTGTFKLADGKITINKLKLSDAEAVTTVTGALELGPSTYHLTGNVQLHDPPEVPSFTVNRSGDLKDAPDYTVSAGAIAEFLTKREPKEAPPAALPVVGTAAMPPVGAQAPLIKGPKLPIGAPVPLVRDATPPPPVDTAPDSEMAPGVTVDKPITIPGDASAPDPGNNNTMDSSPIETEPLEAPPVAPPAPPSPAASPPVNNSPPPDNNAAPSSPPATPPDASPPAPAKGEGGGAIKGILDRLNDTPPANTSTPPADASPPDDQLQKP